MKNSYIKKLYISLLGFMSAFVLFSTPLTFIQAQAPASTDKPTTTTDTPATTNAEEVEAVAPAAAGAAEQSIAAFLCTPDISLYNCINRLYRFGVVAGFFIAVLMIVVAGYMYIVGGEKGKEKGKSYISSTFVAITILLTSYLLLNQINPELTKFKKIQPLNVNPEDLGTLEKPSDVPVFDGNGNTGGGTTPPGGSDSGGTTPPGGSDTGGTPGGTNGNPPANTSRPPSGMVEVSSSTHPGIVLSMKYASTDNFTGARLYTHAKCYLTSIAANKLKTAQAELQKQGKALEIYDCYRPTTVQTLMNDWAGGKTTWAGVQPTKDKSYYVPKYIATSTGGAHPAGRAIDLTIQGLSMPSKFDEFSASAQCPPRNDNCFLLKTIMSQAGFSPYTNEWWHFSTQ